MTFVVWLGLVWSEMSVLVFWDINRASYGPKHSHYTNNRQFYLFVTCIHLSVDNDTCDTVCRDVRTSPVQYPVSAYVLLHAYGSSLLRPACWNAVTLNLFSAPFRNPGFQALLHVRYSGL